jgi:hypothetical protein
MYNYYNYLEPCALNAEFQHFIPRFNKNFLTLRTSLKAGIGGLGFSLGGAGLLNGSFSGSFTKKLWALLQKGAILIYLIKISK